jgi:hypothetical protein
MGPAERRRAGPTETTLVSVTPSEGGRQVKVYVEDGELVIRLPLNKAPAPSVSGKTLVIASTHGNQKTEAVVNGQPVIVGVNAYLQRPTR